MAENINEALLNREYRAAGELREDRAQENIAAAEPQDENQPQGDTLAQKKNIARMAKEKAASAEIAGAKEVSGGLSSATAQALKFAWENMLNPFAAPFSLLYINFHVFGKMVLGEKFFCKLGEEWAPMKNPTTAMTELMGTLKSVGLLEKVVLIVLDLIVLIALLTVIAVVSLAVSFMTDDPLEKAKKMFNLITSLNWSAIQSLIDLFGIVKQ
jgi:hypothetical protein